jgi:hypothetical protein
MDLGRNPLQRTQTTNAVQGAVGGVAQSVSMPAAKANGKVEKKNIALFVLVTLVGLFLFAVLILTSLGSKKVNSSADVKSDRYQAVFINGGIGYFGKVTEMNSERIVMKDVYYLRAENAPGADGKTTQQTVTLAKLEKELIGPESVMFIERKQVLFWENLRNDGQVADAINRDKKGEGTTTNQTTGTNPNTATTPATTPTTPAAATPVTPPATPAATTPTTPVKKP